MSVDERGNGQIEVQGDATGVLKKELTLGNTKAMELSVLMGRAYTSL
jgi:hypothetical protein